MIYSWCKLESWCCCPRTEHGTFGQVGGLNHRSHKLKLNYQEFIVVFKVYKIFRVNLRQTYKMIIRNKFSIIAALIIMYLSLTNSDTFDKVSFLDTPYTDKLVHFAMYFGFMSVLIFENRKKIKNRGQLFQTACIPLGFGILMEILQALFTVSRTGSFYDVLANLSGIIISLSIWLYIEPKIKESIR